MLAWRGGGGLTKLAGDIVAVVGVRRMQDSEDVKEGPCHE